MFSLYGRAAVVQSALVSNKEVEWGSMHESQCSLKEAAHWLSPPEPRPRYDRSVNVPGVPAVGSNNINYTSNACVVGCYTRFLINFNISVAVVDD